LPVERPAELLQRFQDHRDEMVRTRVVRNGHLPERKIQTGIGPVTVKIPKVRGTRDLPLGPGPPVCQKDQESGSGAAVALPERDLHGRDAAGTRSVGRSRGKGLSASTVSRLKQRWAAEYETWQHRCLDHNRWVDVWADGIYSGLRAEDTKLCALVVIGVNERGQKHFLAIEDGMRESTQSWREVLLGLKHRGLAAPELAIGDGALGFWAALEEAYPDTRAERCWMHKTGNVLNALPKTVQAKAKRALHDIWQVATRQDAEAAFDAFIETYEPRYPKAALCLEKDREELMTFYDFPAEKKWRRLRGFTYLAKVIDGVKFVNGEEVQQPDQVAV
jgi:hypothetical protein